MCSFGRKISYLYLGVQAYLQQDINSRSSLLKTQVAPVAYTFPLDSRNWMTDSTLMSICLTLADKSGIQANDRTGQLSDWHKIQLFLYLYL
jgi:hypothetical protein